MRELHGERLAPDHDAGERRELGSGRQLVTEAAIRGLELAEVDRSIGVAARAGRQVDVQVGAVQDAERLETQHQRPIRLLDNDGPALAEVEVVGALELAAQ